MKIHKCKEMPTALDECKLRLFELKEAYQLAFTLPIKAYIWEEIKITNKRIKELEFCGKHLEELK